jgi:putative phosphoribosyl transferase
MTHIRFDDRQDAGRQLASALVQYKQHEVIVYALPRGGVVLGSIIADELQAPLDLLLPRKIGHPLNPEVAICAVTDEGHLFCGEDAGNVDPGWLQEAIEAQIHEAKRRRTVYLGDKKSPRCEGKTAIIVDDGVATGLTMLVAIAQLRDKHPREIIVAVPVLPSDVFSKLKQYVDEIIALHVPARYLGAVGMYYDEFGQVDDETVKKLLESSDIS